MQTLLANVLEPVVCFLLELLVMLGLQRWIEPLRICAGEIGAGDVKLAPFATWLWSNGANGVMLECYLGRSLDSKCVRGGFE